MIQQPEVLDLGAVRTAVIRLAVSPADMRKVMGPGVQELMGVVKVQGIGPTGPWLTHHYCISPELFDFEIAVPVSAPVVPTGRVHAGEVPAARVARVTYVGPYEGLREAWAELGDWIATQKLTPDTRSFEVYALGPESSPDSKTWRTVLHRILKP